LQPYEVLGFASHLVPNIYILPANIHLKDIRRVLFLLFEVKMCLTIPVKLDCLELKCHVSFDEGRDDDNHGDDSGGDDKCTERSSWIASIPSAVGCATGRLKSEPHPESA
jgi:hypothetical protein